MPELPEVETVCRGLNQATLHQPIAGGAVLLPRTIAHPESVDGFLAGMTGVQVIHWGRRGKYLLAELETVAGIAAGWLGVHLRMTGQLLWEKATEPVTSHCRVRLFFPENCELRFVDQRTFGRMWWISPEQRPEQVMMGMAALGPEPFSESFSVDYLYQATRHRLRPIKNALLDQSLVAGIGNIYADEALFISGIPPQVPCKHLGRPRIAKLHAAIGRVLHDSIEAGGTTFSDFRNVQGINGNYGGVAWVYGRDGEPCRICGTTIQRLKLGGRSAHYCPSCQR